MRYISQIMLFEALLAYEKVLDRNPYDKPAAMKAALWAALGDPGSPRQEHINDLVITGQHSDIIVFDDIVDRETQGTLWPSAEFLARNPNGGFDGPTAAE